MLLSNLLLIAGFLLPLAALWAAVLWIRPAVARARVEHEAFVVRDRVMDGVLAGDIDADNPRAIDAIRYCEFLAQNAHEVRFSTTLATAIGLRNARTEFVKQAELREQTVAEASRGMASAAGERRLQESEQDLDHILAWYLVRGSSLWWVLAPIQRLSRLLDKRAKRSAVVNETSPTAGELAREVGASANGRSSVSPAEKLNHNIFPRRTHAHATPKKGAGEGTTHTVIDNAAHALLDSESSVKPGVLAKVVRVSASGKDEPSTVWTAHDLSAA